MYSNVFQCISMYSMRVGIFSTRWNTDWGPLSLSQSLSFGAARLDLNLTNRKKTLRLPPPPPTADSKQRMYSAGWGEWSPSMQHECSGQTEDTHLSADIFNGRGLGPPNPPPRHRLLLLYRRRVSCRLNHLAISA